MPSATSSTPDRRPPCAPSGASFSSSTNTVMAATGYSQFTIHPGWQAVGDSSLICLGPAGDVIKRLTISPSDTNVGTMIADARAAAKAAADAAAAAQKVRRR